MTRLAPRRRAVRSTRAKLRKSGTARSRSRAKRGGSVELPPGDLGCVHARRQVPLHLGDVVALAEEVYRLARISLGQRGDEGGVERDVFEPPRLGIDHDVHGRSLGPHQAGRNVPVVSGRNQSAGSARTYESRTGGTSD